ncbi:MAG: Gmad2 immunoglobulin-like domain-containing protein [Nocardioides sp.]
MDDQDLRTALESAVENVEPTDRLHRIRHETRSHVRRRRAWLAAGGAGLALASVVTVALLTGTSSPQRAPDPAVSPSPEPSTTSSTYSVFYLGPGPDGPAAPADTLYRARVVSPSLVEALTRSPSDPDYRTLWPSGSLGAIAGDSGSGDVVTVALRDETLAERPAEMSLQEALLALQQVVYSVQAAFDTRAGVRFEWPDGSAAETVYGVPADLVEAAPALEVLSHMSIDRPIEGATYRRDVEAFSARGRGNSFEASGACSLQGDDGFTVGPFLATMSGWMGPRLFGWEATIDLRDVPAGTYVFECSTDDPTGGTEGRGTDYDTRTVVIE